MTKSTRSTTAALTSYSSLSDPSRGYPCPPPRSYDRYKVPAAPLIRARGRAHAHAHATRPPTYAYPRKKGKRERRTLYPPPPSYPHTPGACAALRLYKPCCSHPSSHSITPTHTRAVSQEKGKGRDGARGPNRSAISFSCRARVHRSVALSPLSPPPLSLSLSLRIRVQVTSPREALEKLRTIRLLLLLLLLPIRLDGNRTTGFSRPLARSRRQHEDHVGRDAHRRSSPIQRQQRRRVKHARRAVKSIPEKPKRCWARQATSSTSDRAADTSP